MNYMYVGSPPIFDQSVYHRQFEYCDVQIAGRLFFMQLTRELSEEEVISSSTLVGENCSRNFYFNKTTLAIDVLEALNPGRCEFLVVIRITSLITATVVIDISSPGKSSRKDIMPDWNWKPVHTCDFFPS